MAISVSGSGAVTGSSPQSITVPADTKRLVFFWAAFEEVPVDLDSATIGGDALTQHAKVVDGSGSGTSTGTASRATPSTGSQSLAWTWTVAPAEGPVLFWVAFTATGTIDVAGSVAEADESVTVTSTTDDYVAALFQQFGGTIDTTGYTSVVGPSTVNGEVGQVVTTTAGNPSTTFTMGAGNFRTVTAISLREVGGGGGGAVEAPSHTPTLSFPVLSRKPRNDNGRWSRGQGGLWVPRRAA